MSEEVLLGVSNIVVIRESAGLMVRVLQLPKPNRHHHIHRHYKDFGLGHPGFTNELQGFYTNKRNFVSREQALEIATASGQLRKKHGCEYHLFSEDVW